MNSTVAGNQSGSQSLWIIVSRVFAVICGVIIITILFFAIANGNRGLVILLPFVFAICLILILLFLNKAKVMFYGSMSLCIFIAFLSTLSFSVPDSKFAEINGMPTFEREISPGFYDTVRYRMYEQSTRYDVTAEDKDGVSFDVGVAFTVTVQGNDDGLILVSRKSDSQILGMVRGKIKDAVGMASKKYSIAELIPKIAPGSGSLLLLSKLTTSEMQDIKGLNILLSARVY